MADKKITWYGHAGHLIVSDSCRFHLCTEIGQYLISTVGDYYNPSGIRDKIGCDRFFETYVFTLGANPARCKDKACLCGLPVPDNLSEIDSMHADTAGKAMENHMTMLKKYGKRKPL